MRILTIITMLTFVFAQELEVEGDLKVSGTIDVQGNPITNVGDPLLSTDAVNAEYLSSVLTDDGTWEYLNYRVKIPLVDTQYSLWQELDGDTNEWDYNWSGKLGQLSDENWKIYNIMNSDYNDGVYSYYFMVLHRRIN